MEVVASLSQGRTAAAQCGLFTYKSVPVIFEPPCIYIPRTVRHNISWRYILTLYCHTLVSLPGLTCPVFCVCFITLVTQCSSQFRVAVPIYLPWTSVFTLSRGPLWPSVIFCFPFLTMWGCYPDAFPGATELPLVMCPPLIIHCNTCSYVHIPRPSLQYRPEDATHSWGKRRVQHGLLKYCSYTHMKVCFCVCVCVCVVFLCLFVWFKDASKSHLHAIENKQVSVIPRAFGVRYLLLNIKRKVRNFMFSGINFSLFWDCVV